MESEHPTVKAAHRYIILVILMIAQGAAGSTQTNALTNSQPAPLDELVGWTTNGPIVLSVHTLKMPRTFMTNSAGRAVPRPYPTRLFTNLVFDHFLPGSLSHLVWTNLLAHTNGR